MTVPDLHPEIIAASIIYTALDALVYAGVYVTAALVLLVGFDWRLVAIFLVLLRCVMY